MCKSQNNIQSVKNTMEKILSNPVPKTSSDDFQNLGLCCWIVHNFISSYTCNPPQKGFT